MPTSLTPQAAAEAINRILGLESGEHIDLRDLCVSDLVVCAGLTDNRLRQRLFDIQFPKSPSGTYHHYTTYKGFKGITSSGRLRLYNLHKRGGSGEFVTFCRDHKLSGYFRDGTPSSLSQAQRAAIWQRCFGFVPRFQNISKLLSNMAGGRAFNPRPGMASYAYLMTHFYYVSFVKEEDSLANKFWSKFAHDYEGVRMDFEVSANAYPYFRTVLYQAPTSLSPLGRLQEHFGRYGRKFVAPGLHYMAAFYLRRKYNYQSEHRLVIENTLAAAGFPFAVKHKKRGKSGPIDFIECDLTNKCPLPLTIRLKGVVAGKKSPIKHVQDYLDKQSVIRGLKATQE